jgi:hypothetical protein
MSVYMKTLKFISLGFGLSFCLEFRVVSEGHIGLLEVLEREDHAQGKRPEQPRSVQIVPAVLNWQVVWWL